MADDSAELLPLENPDPFMTCIQPGSGVCMRIELAWGSYRRWFLRTFCPGYVRRMSAAREGDASACPFELIDSRDVKFYRNVCNVRWSLPDRFAWRDRLPFARAGYAELLMFAGVSLASAALLSVWSSGAGMIAALPAVFTFWFFRDPERRIPQEAGLIVSPADGKIVTIEPIEYDEFVGGPALLIGIFLSVFNVHVNRAPCECRMIGQTYRRGKFLNALLPASARENEQLEHRLQELVAPYRRMRVRQIAGAIARRIVCWTPIGAQLDRGERIGMIKFGSRTEIILPRNEDCEVRVRIGEKVSAGSSVLVRYVQHTTPDVPTVQREPTQQPTATPYTAQAKVNRDGSTTQAE